MPERFDRVGGIPEVVEDNQSGLLVPFGDVAALAGALEGLIDDKARRALLVGPHRLALVNGSPRRSSCRAMKHSTGGYVDDVLTPPSVPAKA